MPRVLLLVNLYVVFDLFFVSLIAIDNYFISPDATEFTHLMFWSSIILYCAVIAQVLNLIKICVSYFLYKKDYEFKVKSELLATLGLTGIVPVFILIYVLSK